MRSPEIQLSDLDHSVIFRKLVLPESGSEAVAHETPRAVILAGQPGAGKGGLARTVEYEFSNDTVKIDPDELRVHHPEFSRLREKYPYTWSDYTHSDVIL